MTKKEYRSDDEFAKKHSYITLTAELYGVFSEDFGA